MVKDLLRASLFDDHPIFHDDEAVAQGSGDRQVVRDEEQGEALLGLQARE